MIKGSICIEACIQHPVVHIYEHQLDISRLRRINLYRFFLFGRLKKEGRLLFPKGSGEGKIESALER